MPDTNTVRSLPSISIGRVQAANQEHQMMIEWMERKTNEPGPVFSHEMMVLRCTLIWLASEPRNDPKTAKINLANRSRNDSSIHINPKITIEWVAAAAAAAAEAATATKDYVANSAKCCILIMTYGRRLQPPLYIHTVHVWMWLNKRASCDAIVEHFQKEIENQIRSVCCSCNVKLFLLLKQCRRVHARTHTYTRTLAKNPLIKYA